VNISNTLKTLINAFANEPYQHVIAKIWRKVRKSVNPSYIHYKTADSILSKHLKQDRSISFDFIISFITPVFNPSPEHLNETIGSVLNQTADNWELCIHDDASNEEIKEILQNYEKRDSRVKLSLGNQNKGIVHASNKAIRLAKGLYIAFLDHDDCIHPDTVRLISNTIQSDNDVKLLFTNEDSINIDGFVESKLDKLPFSHQTLRSVNYINHLTIIQKKLGDKLGWLRNDYEGAQDYDLLLRATESLKSEWIALIPKTLYHWRMTDTSISKHAWAKKYVQESAQKALNAHLKRIGTNIKCTTGKKSGTFDLIPVLENEPFILIDIQIYSFNEYSLTLQSFIQNTSYKNFKINKPEYWDNLPSHLKDSDLFIEKITVEKDHNDYFICIITESLQFPQRNWLKILMTYNQINKNSIIAPLIISSTNKIYCDGLFYIDKKLTNLYKDENKNNLLDYFSGITKEVNGVYNICYICANTALDTYNTIVVCSLSEVKLITNRDTDYSIILAK